MKVAIIGCGLIGQKRAKTLGACELVACVDKIKDRAENLARQHVGCVALTDWKDAVELPEVDIVIIATLHSTLAEITHGAVKQGKHVLVEKPAARCSVEIPPIIEEAKRTGSLVRVGFNHRYHRSLRQARSLVDAGKLGELMFIRARYGHGGRIGYDKEWRAQPDLSGGGELIDQGPHLIDLSRWFLGDFCETQGFAHTYYWDMPVDDNGFLLLKTKQKQAAFIHVSCTEWKNLFSMEIYGRNGKLELSGLGGSYGVEKLTWYDMLPEMGPPATQSWEYPMADDSWSVEMTEFLDDIRLNRNPAPGLNDAYAVLEIIEAIYKESGYDHCTKSSTNYLGGRGD